jgi:hypothetical protein
MPENRKSTPEEIAAGMAPVTGRPRRRERLDPPCAEAPGCANGYHGPPCPYAVTPIPPDAARDARVAARRAVDAARAGRALDRLLSEVVELNPFQAFHAGWQARNAECELHHNRHYAVPDRCQCPNGMPDGWGHDGGPACPRPAAGPPCSCSLASDTGHAPECPRADWARGNR